MRQKPLPGTHPKTDFGLALGVWRRLYEKELDPSMLQASLRIGVPALFLCALRMRLLRNRPAVVGCLRGDAVFPAGKTSGWRAAAREDEDDDHHQP